MSLLPLVTSLQQPVLTTKADELGAAASGNSLLFEQSPANAFGVGNSYVRTGGATVRLNPVNTNSYTAGIDGNTVIYQLSSRTGHISNLRLYDIATKVRSNPPPGFNTSWWEYGPTISGNWILFGRDSVPKHRRNQVILRNRVTGKQIILGNMVIPKNAFAYLIAGQVNSHWAVWTRCVPTNCNVYRYDITTGTTTKLVNTNPAARFSYLPSVSSNGTLFYIHGERGCGNHTTLAERPVGGPETILVHFKPGMDVVSTSASADPSSGTDVYYSRVDCRNNHSDVYKVVAP